MIIDPVLDALRAGEPVLLPTDTVYGLAALATDADAVARLFALKQRPVDTRIVALVADIEQAEELVELGPVGRLLAEVFWPGALTIVATRRPGVDAAVGDTLTVGVRCPDNEIVRTLAHLAGPLAVTSANLHGELPPATAAEVASLFATVQVVVDGGKSSGAASTVISIVDESLTVLREGPITAAEIDTALRGGS